jgi:hypothetical protein
MRIDDIEVLEKITAKHKYRYEVLDTCFEESIIGTIIYVPINITILLTELAQFGDSLDDNVDFKMHSAIAIMNLFAHYKHYYTVKKAESVIIVGFVKDNYYYKQYENIITIVENMCEFFPNVYFMSNIASMKHTILVGGFLRYIHSIIVTDFKSSIHIYSSFNVDKQLLCLFPTKEAYKVCKLMNTTTVDFLSKRQFINKVFKDNTPAYDLVHMYRSEIERLVVILGVYFGSYECFSSSERNTYSFPFTRDKLVKKADKVSQFITKYYNRNNSQENINNQFEKYICQFLINQSDSVSLASYIKKYDFFSHQGQYIHNVMKELYNASKAKIKDYAMSKESEKYKLLIHHQLYANWLL